MSELGKKVSKSARDVERHGAAALTMEPPRKSLTGGWSGRRLRGKQACLTRRHYDTDITV